MEDEFTFSLWPELYERIDNWRHLFANSYSMSVPEMNLFIAVLLERSELDLRILMWDFSEAIGVIEKLGIINLN